MENRPNRRFMRRLQVRFRESGGEKSWVGFTTNISETGMFVATVRPSRPGTRLDVEITDKKLTLKLGAVVVHARKSPANFQQIMPSGVGVRFLNVADRADNLRKLMGRA